MTAWHDTIVHTANIMSKRHDHMMNEDNTTLNFLHHIDNEQDILRTNVIQYLLTEHYAM